MELILENLKSPDPVGNRIEALKTLTKLLLYEIESLEEIAPSKNTPNAEATIALSDEVQRFEANLICNALLESRGNQSRAARKLGIKTSTLHAKIRRYAIDSLNLFGQFANDEDFRREQLLKNGTTDNNRNVVF
jgi:DNA-binding NtrC family response regulator